MNRLVRILKDALDHNDRTTAHALADALAAENDTMRQLLQVAVVILEPLAGTAGLVPGWLQRVQALAPASTNGGAK